MCVKDSSDAACCSFEFGLNCLLFFCTPQLSCCSSFIVCNPLYLVVKGTNIVLDQRWCTSYISFLADTSFWANYLFNAPLYARLSVFFFFFDNQLKRKCETLSLKHIQCQGVMSVTNFILKCMSFYWTLKPVQCQGVICMCNLPCCSVHQNVQHGTEGDRFSY